MSNSSLQAVINSGNLNNISDAFAKMALGDFLSLFIAATAVASPTEAAVVPVANVAPLASQPTTNGLFQVNVKTVGAGGATGIKKLRRGPISGPNAIVPASGECVWDGMKSILFAAVDAALTVDVLYAVATTAASCMLADLPSGQSTL